ncbi:GNAT family N-acetyltransferase [Altererythrobacter lauratis]|uniref:GNAT family N-acetyltransferase n=1 Tax=Alteraurantiacibacter lauratis TaxID=2054627 RepID=A0ABV7EFH5_9SPHN
MTSPGAPAVAVHLRRAQETDAPALQELIRQLGYERTAEDIAAQLAALDLTRQNVIVAELAGEVIGCLSTSIMHVLHRPRPVGRISMMVVAQHLRGHRIGAALVREAERVLAEAGCGFVEVTSNAKRADAHRIYERLGYQRTSLRFARDVSSEG